MTTDKADKADKDIKRLLRKLHGPGGGATLAALCVEDILSAMYPKFSEEWEDEGYNEDEEGYVEDYEWPGADLLECIARTLHLHGFGPKREVLKELKGST